MPVRRLSALLAVLVLLVAAGCGGGGESESEGVSSVAGVLPADAPLVLEFSVGPDSEQGKAALAFAEKVDPEGRDLSRMLEDELDESLREDDVTYGKDIEPWLGEQILVTVDGFDEFSGIVAAEVEDRDAARALLEKPGKDEKPVDKTYEGVDYRLDEDEGDAGGLIGDYLVLASDEAHFKQAVDASKGTGALADDAKYQAALDEAPDERLALVYADVTPLLAVLKDTKSLPPEFATALDQIPGAAGGGQAVAALTAEDDELAIETVGKADGAAAAAASGTTTADLPGSSWVAFAGPIMGESLVTGIEQGMRQAGGAEALGALENTGVREFLTGLKSLSVFFGGTEITKVNGGLDLQGADADAAAQVVTFAADQVQALAGSNVQVDRVGTTATFGAAPYKATLKAEGADLKLQFGEPSSDKLADADAFKRGTEVLDLDAAAPGFFLDFAPLETLVKSLGAGDANVDQAVKVLAKLGVLVAGNEVDDGVAHGRIVLTTR